MKEYCLESPKVEIPHGYKIKTKATPLHKQMESKASDGDMHGTIIIF